MKIKKIKSKKNLTSFSKVEPGEVFYFKEYDRGNDELNYYLKLDATNDIERKESGYSRNAVCVSSGQLWTFSPYDYVRVLDSKMVVSS
jgi:hypothetical protein